LFVGYLKVDLEQPEKIQEGVRRRIVAAQKIGCGDQKRRGGPSRRIGRL
jgi:hypothetical protein